MTAPLKTLSDASHLMYLIGLPPADMVSNGEWNTAVDALIGALIPYRFAAEAVERTKERDQKQGALDAVNAAFDGLDRDYARLREHFHLARLHWEAERTALLNPIVRHKMMHPDPVNFVVPSTCPHCHKSIS